MKYHRLYTSARQMVRSVHCRAGIVYTYARTDMVRFTKGLSANYVQYDTLYLPVLAGIGRSRIKLSSKRALRLKRLRSSFRIARKTYNGY